MTRTEKYKDLRLSIYEANKRHGESVANGNMLSIWFDSLKPKGKHVKKEGK